MKVIVAIVMALLCAPAYSQQGLSPKLSQFLLDHPGAYKVLTDVLQEANSKRPVHIYYFYVNAQAHQPTMHRLLEGESILGVFVVENQSPLSECVDILFELLNSKGERRFKELRQKAASGRISKQEYVREFLKEEFRAVIATKKMLPDLWLSEKEASESPQYKWFKEVPTEFEEFLVYRSKGELSQDNTDYEKQYDAIRALR